MKSKGDRNLANLLSDSDTVKLLEAWSAEDAKDRIYWCGEKRRKHGLNCAKTDRQWRNMSCHRAPELAVGSQTSRGLRTTIGDKPVVASRRATIPSSCRVFVQAAANVLWVFTKGRRDVWTGC